MGRIAFGAVICPSFLSNKSVSSVDRSIRAMSKHIGRPSGQLIFLVFIHPHGYVGGNVRAKSRKWPCAEAASSNMSLGL